MLRQKLKTNIYVKTMPPNLAGFFMVLYTMGSNP